MCLFEKRLLKNALFVDKCFFLLVKIINVFVDKFPLLVTEIIFFSADTCIALLLNNNFCLYVFYTKKRCDMANKIIIWAFLRNCRVLNSLSSFQAVNEWRHSLFIHYSFIH